MIGIFDSGSGGLSVLAALRQIAPRADAAYFGDIARAPYGERGADELAELFRSGIETLAAMGATELVSACNSVSPAVLAGAAGSMPAIEMTRPAARGMRARAGQRVLLIATPATVASNIYADAFAGAVRLEQLALSNLARAIEFEASEEGIARIVREAFAPRRGQTFDALLLGCTHYPLARDVIEEEAWRALGAVAIVDPAAFVAEAVARSFDIAGSGKLAFRISAESGQFRRRVAALFPDVPYSIEVV